MGDLTLNAEDVSVEFAGLKALDRVSLTLAQGEILGLIGPNGSGKTTLVNAITGQVPLAGGRIVIGDVDLTGRPPREVALAGIARTFQIGRHFDGLSVLEGVATAALAQGDGMGVGRAKAAALLGELGLADRADDLASALSYGDKRRLELARALAGAPAFLLLDEPAAGMNDAETESLLDLLVKLPAARRVGLLIIDHDMSLIMRLCQRLQVLASGKTIASGDREQVRKNPAVIEAYLGSEAGQATETADA
ncbi:MAG: ABC transporter ATP-binding protein [Alphaproteobacteria bacterium]